MDNYASQDGGRIRNVESRWLAYSEAYIYLSLANVGLTPRAGFTSQAGPGRSPGCAFYLVSIAEMTLISLRARWIVVMPVIGHKRRSAKLGRLE